jgi:haloacetate dehalogenase
MFEGFAVKDVEVSPGITIHARVGGSGPAVLLLHGSPQTHVCWHKVAPKLAEKFTVVAADLRGYGDSSKPPGGGDHSDYSKRHMAQDQVSLMKSLGFDKFSVVGHDRGGRVAHRMALDHVEAIENLAVLDIAPTATMYERTDLAFATGYYHWFFLIQPEPLPENLISGSGDWYIRSRFTNPNIAHHFIPEAVEEYARCFLLPGTIHANCEDYRASASIDLGHDAIDQRDGRKIQAPVLALWGERGLVGKLYDVLETWQEKAVKVVTGKALPCGHFLPEEAPAQTVAALLEFL